MTTKRRLNIGVGFGARWCADHNRWECASNKSRGRGACHAAAIRGTAKCPMHSGKTTALAKAQGEARITAWSINGNPDIDYRMAVLSVLQMTCLRLAAYSELLRQQVAIQGDKSPEVFDPENPEPSGLIGNRFGAAGKDGVIYAQSEEVRALVALEAAERDRVVKYSKTAHDMGISERLTSLAERWGDVVAGRITALLGDPQLQLRPEQLAVVPQLISTHLGTINVEQLGGSVLPAAKPNGSARGVRDGGGPST